jgi:hypothetical protein
MSGQLQDAAAMCIGEWVLAYVQYRNVGSILKHLQVFYIFTHARFLDILPIVSGVKLEAEQTVMGSAVQKRNETCFTVRDMSRGPWTFKSNVIMPLIWINNRVSQLIG